MSFDVLGEVNWLAVIVATIAYFALGALWFNPKTFGAAWMRSIGWEPPAGERPGLAFYVGPLVATFVAVVAVAMLAAAAGAEGFGDGFVLGLVVGVGIAGALFFVTAVFEPTKPEPWVWFGVSAGYHLVGLLIAAILVSVW